MVSTGEAECVAKFRFRVQIFDEKQINNNVKYKAFIEIEGSSEKMCGLRAVLVI